jgi:hypothetical protein
MRYHQDCTKLSMAVCRVVCRDRGQLPLCNVAVCAGLDYMKACSNMSQSVKCKGGAC